VEENMPIRRISIINAHICGFRKFGCTRIRSLIARENLFCQSSKFIFKAIGILKLKRIIKTIYNQVFLWQTLN